MNNFSFWFKLIEEEEEEVDDVEMKICFQSLNDHVRSHTSNKHIGQSANHSSLI